MQHAFDENREWKIILKIWANLKKIFANVVVLYFVSFSDWKMQKKSLKTDFENLVHVYL
jgi:hypothetical protein